MGNNLITIKKNDEHGKLPLVRRKGEEGVLLQLVMGNYYNINGI
jgi:hypothetical protein